MGNIVNYVKKFGHLSFKDKPFNDVDALILSELVYLNFDDFIPSLDDDKKSVRLIPLLTDYNINKMCKKTLDDFWCRILLKEIRHSNRYKNLKLNYFQNLFLTDQIEQFCAVTYEINNIIYVAFRGTDASLLGWYEDFNMLLMDAIPSQNSASRYLKEVAKRNNKKIIVGGHSKGGNLAVYASLYCEKKIKDRIINIYDFDGPGFNKNIFTMQEYKDIEYRIIKMTVEESLIGVLMFHRERMLFVKSRGISIFQHDIFNWKIKKNGEFKFVKNANLQSLVFKKAVDEFINSTSEKDRELIINLVFKVIMENKESTLFDVVSRPFRYSLGISKRYRKLEKGEKKLLKNGLKRYIRIYNKTLVNILKRRLSFKHIK